MAYQAHGLYYITHIANLPSILEHGILSRAEIERRGFTPRTIDNSAINNIRKDKLSPAGKSLWDYASFYFQPRNPMLYQALQGPENKNIVILQIDRKVISSQKDTWVMDGNAAQPTNVYPCESKTILAVSKGLDIEYWSEADGTKHKIMAECLIQGAVAPQFIEHIFTANATLAQHVKTLTDVYFPSISVSPNAHMFFQPDFQETLTDKLSLMKGDMFFSKFQTMTVTVNTKGVMGKGLALRAKLQFPDVYVKYQEACRNKTLRTDKPVLIKRESSLASQLSDTPSEDENNTWFLLFATKEHWRSDSKIEYIVDGLRYLSEYYAQWGIRSLALPALGCGLGNLTWAEVGPIICSTVNEFDMEHVAVYLPAEHAVDPKHLTADYLLR